MQPQFIKAAGIKLPLSIKTGSLANYDILAPVHLLVTPGDYVHPGQPLAVFNKESEKYTVLLSTFYLDEKKFIAYNNDKASLPSYFVYITAHFYCAEEKQSTSLQLDKIYSVEHPLEIVIAEMSKREKKKFGYK